MLQKKKEDVLTNILNKQLNSRILILERKSTENMENIYQCNQIIKSYTKFELNFLFENNINSPNTNYNYKGVRVSTRIDSKFKLLTPIKTKRKSSSKDQIGNGEITIKRDNKSIKTKLRELTPRIRNQIKSPKKEQTIEIDGGQTRLDTIDSLRYTVKTSQTQKNLKILSLTYLGSHLIFH